MSFFGSSETQNLSVFSNIGAVKIEGNLKQNGQKLQITDHFDFSQTSQFFSRFLTDLTEVCKDESGIEDNAVCVLTVPLQNKTIQANFDGYHNIQKLRKIFDVLLKTDLTTKDAYKYNVKLMFENCEVPFANFVSDIKFLEEVVEILGSDSDITNHKFAVSVNPIPVKIGNFSSVREGMTFEGLNPKAVSSLIKNSKVE